MVARRQLEPGYYRLARDIRVLPREDGGLVICRYPLRAIRPGAAALRLLVLCGEQHTCEELARLANLPLKRVEALCDQLRWKGLLEAGPAPAPPTWPAVSIIIPSHNRARQLERCLRALRDLEYPVEGLEIIAVDDASTDETGAMLRRIAPEFAACGLALRVVCHSRQQGVALSRNTGARAARHDLLAYIDSDCVASPGWLAELVPVFQDVSIAAAGGMIRAYERQSIPGRYEDVSSSLFMGVHARQVRLAGPLTYLPTASLLVRREMWQRLGGFAPLTFGEDVDFCHRLLATGSRMLYLPRGTVYHDYRTGWGAFLGIRAAYASAEAALLERHPAERRVLVLPPEQAIFAGLAIGGICGVCAGEITRGGGIRPGRGRPHNAAVRYGLFSLMIAFASGVFSASRRLRKVRKQRIPIGPLAIFQATLRGHLAYTYHLCRHLTRYYTLPLLAIGLLIPPLLMLAFVLCSIVIAVDYVRLRPSLGVGAYALCSVLDDCAYEVGVVLGCIKQRTWKPLLPIVKRKILE